MPTLRSPYRHKTNPHTQTLLDLARELADRPEEEIARAAAASPSLLALLITIRTTRWAERNWRPTL
jgi:hypothetical protein